MGRDVHFTDEIGQAIAAASYAGQATLEAISKQENDTYAQGYQAGYQAALLTLAIAFGVVEIEAEGQPASLPAYQHPGITAGQ